MHGVGVDISEFNSMIAHAKVAHVNLLKLNESIKSITYSLQKFLYDSKTTSFEDNLLEELKRFNSEYFPNPEFKLWVKNKRVNEKKYAEEKEKEFLPIYNKLIDEFRIDIKQEKQDNFIDKWYFNSAKEEIDLVFNKIKKIKDVNMQDYTCRHSKQNNSLM